LSEAEVALQRSRAYESVLFAPSRPLLALACSLSIAGCARCSSTSDTKESDKVEQAPLPPLMLSALLPQPTPWTFAPVRLYPGVAQPTGCSPRAPIVRAKVAPSTRFVAEPRALATLIVADAEGHPPRLTGVGAMRLDPEGKSNDAAAVPWLSAASLPRLARTGRGAWIAGFDRPAAEGMSRVGLWYDGKAEPVGEGDAFEAADLVCVGEDCALLTSRLAKVAPSGAMLWLGRAGEAVSTWRKVEIVPAASGSRGDARPFQIAAVTAAKGADAGAGLEVVVALVAKDDISFYRVDGGAQTELGTLPTGHGVIDTAVAPLPLAMVYATPLDDDGCSTESAPGGGAAIRFERGGGSVTVKTPAPPLDGFLRPLQQGTIATWIAPLGCNQARRVVYGLVLDAQGNPVGAPMPIGDGESFAIASSGDDVDLWLQHGDAVTWMRMRCATTP